MTQSSASSALSGVRVLDFTRVLAGPFCTMMLADLGADVIKIEDPQRGDETRQWGPPWAGDGDALASARAADAALASPAFGEGRARSKDTDAQSAYYLSVNRNKRSLTLNLKSAEGQQIARTLAAESAVVVENFKPGQMARFGLGFDDLSALRPALVYCSLTGYGQEGPWADRPGYDFVVQGMSGLMSITGPIGGEPYKVGVALSDVIAGLNAATSILAALRHAEATGQGQHLDVALLDTSLAALVNVAENYLVSGQPSRRYGNAHASIVPYQSFRAADGEFTVACGNDRQFAQLCTLIGRDDLSADPHYATNPARVTHRESLIPVLQAAFEARPSAEWVEGLLALGIPAGPIEDVASALESEHAQARGLTPTVTLDNGATTRLVGPPVGFSATPPTVRTPPPAHGQHTDELLHTLGLDAATIADYRQRGVI